MFHPCAKSHQNPFVTFRDILHTQRCTESDEYVTFSAEVINHVEKSAVSEVTIIFTIVSAISIFIECG